LFNYQSVINLQYLPSLTQNIKYLETYRATLVTLYPPKMRL